ncbi:MAG: hypothetical protein WCI06_07350 [Methylococcaceae bacterium]
MNLFIIAIVLVLLPFIVIAGHFENKKRERLIQEGKGDYFVKIAASGKGGVYHKPSCGKCRSNNLISQTQARNQGYVPCSICGGQGVFSKFK